MEQVAVCTGHIDGENVLLLIVTVTLHGTGQILTEGKAHIGLLQRAGHGAQREAHLQSIYALACTVLQLQGHLGPFSVSSLQAGGRIRGRQPLQGQRHDQNRSPDQAYDFFVHVLLLYAWPRSGAVPILTYPRKW